MILLEETRLGASPPNFPDGGEIFDGGIWGGRPQSRFFQADAEGQLNEPSGAVVKPWWIDRSLLLKSTL